MTVAAGGSCAASDNSGTINLTVADGDSPVEGLTLSASSSNQALVPDANVTVGGSGANRTMTAAAVREAHRHGHADGHSLRRRRDGHGRDHVRIGRQRR